MKNENEIKRAFAMEVIEKLKAKEIISLDCVWDKGINIGLKDAIEIVQSLLPKEEVHVDIDSGKVTIKPKEEEVDWSKATKEQRLKFANDNYGEGVQFLSLTHRKNISSGKFIYYEEGDIINVVMNGGYDEGGFETTIYNLEDEWAEIVEPETKTEYDTNPPIHPTLEGYERIVKLIFESDEVKAGEEVICVYEKNIELEDKSFWTGGIDRTNGEFICQSESGEIFTCPKIRKSQPSLEQKARKKAEEMKESYRHAHGFRFDNKRFFDFESTELMLIEALLIDPKTL